MSEELKCPICGKPTNVYFGNARKDRLCLEHGKMANNGEIEQCPDCNKWHKTGEVCECKSHNEKTKSNSEELTCIICGKPSNGKHFCIDCWQQYKDRSIDIRLKNLKFDSLLDDYGNLKYKCEDGRYVRSLQEQSIANTLWNLGIQYVYEEQVNYFTEDEQIKKLHPDFYLPKYNTYIEHIGFTSKKHDNITEYKKKIYEEQGKKVLFTNTKNLTDFKNFIKETFHIN